MFTVCFEDGPFHPSIYLDAFPHSYTPTLPSKVIYLTVFFAKMDECLLTNTVY